LGQALLRQNKTGSVIDHISVEHVVGMQMPMIRDEQFQAVSRYTRDATQLTACGASLDSGAEKMV
jgi:hypothetical protein